MTHKSKIMPATSPLFCNRTTYLIFLSQNIASFAWFCILLAELWQSSIGIVSMFIARLFLFNYDQKERNPIEPIPSEQKLTVAPLQWYA